VPVVPILPNTNGLAKGAPCPGGSAKNVEHLSCPASRLHVYRQLSYANDRVSFQTPTLVEA